MVQSSSNDDSDDSCDEHEFSSYGEYLSNKGYFIGDKINSGSFATVRYADRVKDHKVEKMAVKIINKTKASSIFLEKFLPRELDIWPRLKHRHIIKVHEIYSFRDKIYVFMELAAKGSVIDFLTENGPVKEELAQKWIKRLCQALKFCHRRGIAHRDVKCDNVLVTENLEIKLGDFGFCCDTADLKIGNKKIYSDTYCGSAAYVAPEVLMGLPYDPIPADVWSTGVCMYIILNNALPFDDSNFAKLHQCQLKGQWKFIPQIEKALSSSVKKLLPKMLNPNPTKRLTIDQVLNSAWMKR